MIEVGVSVVLILIALVIVHNRNESALSKDRISADSGHRLIMGTFARVVAIAKDTQIAEKSITSAFEQLQTVDELMSDYKEDSEISKVNKNAYKATVAISRPTFEVLQKSLEFSRLTDGAFDITVGPLVDLWRKAADANSTPSAKQLAETSRRVGYEKLILEADSLTVRFAVDDMRLDLGGIAKGYAIDKAVEAMRKTGAIGGMVDVGGDIRCFGPPAAGKEKWVIGLQDPAGATDQTAPIRYPLVLKFNDAAVATSGDYRRFVLIEGKKYSHIINKQTGLGSDKLASVTIIAETAVEADALATAVSVMGREKGMALIEKTPNVEAILISAGPEFELSESTGAGKYINDNQNKQKGK